MQPYKAVALPYLLMLSLITSSCGVTKEWLGIRDRAEDYLLAGSPDDLIIPSDMQPIEREDLQPLPDVSVNSDGRQRLLQMPSALVNPSLGNVRIQTLGARSWLVMDISAAQLWPRLRGFISLNNIPVTRVNNSQGLVETNWLKPQPGVQAEKYQFTILPGLRPETSELHILHADESAADDWPLISHSAEKTRTMMLRFATYLTSFDNQPVPVSATAASIAAAQRMTVTTDEQGVPIVRLAVAYERAWASAEYALEQAGIYILDRNHQSGEFFIAYDPKKTVTPGEKKRKNRPQLNGRETRESLPEQLTPEQLAERVRKLPKFRLSLKSDGDQVRMTPFLISEEREEDTPQLISALIHLISSFIS